MKFQITTTDLKSAMSVCAKTISSKNTMPILDCALLHRTEKSNYAFVASDSEHTVVIATTMTVDDYRPICLPIRTCMEILSAMPEQPLTFAINDDTLECTCTYQSGKYQFMTYKADEYPSWGMKNEPRVQIHAAGADILGSLHMAVPFVANDELRPVMNGVYMDSNTPSMTFVSSDGHKLFKVSNDHVHIDLNDDTNGIIFPVKGIALLKMLLRDEDLTITADGKTVCCTTSRFMLYSRRIEGRYPNYASVIPKAMPHALDINRKELLGAIRRVVVMASKTTAMVRFDVVSGMDRVEVSTSDTDYSSSASEAIQLATVPMFDMTIGFKADFLMRMLDTSQADNVRMEFVDPGNAMVMTDVDVNPDLLMLLMPMMLND